MRGVFGGASNHDAGVIMSEPLLTIEELAQKLRISSRTIRRLVGEGLPRIQVTRKLHRYELNTVMAWMAARKTAHNKVLQ